MFVVIAWMSAQVVMNFGTGRLRQRRPSWYVITRQLQAGDGIVILQTVELLFVFSGQGERGS